jgi:hypothetical protein
MSPDEKNARLLEAAAVLLFAAQDQRLNTVSLNKALFHLDLGSLRDFGQVFTFTPYIALDMGPVVAKYEKRLIKPLEEAGIATQSEDGLALPVSLNRLPQFHLINPDIRDLAERVSQWCSGQTSWGVSDFSHQNPGWIIAREEERHASGKKQVIDMNIAMQQIVDHDPWMNEPLSVASLAACRSADDAKGDPW